VRRLAALLLSTALAATAAGQEIQPVEIDRLPVSLAGTWLFRTGHDPAWASPFRERRNWYPIAVPGGWERHGYPGYDGHAWYRLPFRLSSQLAGLDLGIDLGLIGDVDEVFLNGRKVGGTGSPPPRLDRAPLARRFYPLPREAIRFGEYNELAVHVYNDTRFGGLLGPAPRIDQWERLLRFQVLRDLLVFSLATLLFTLALFHLALFLMQRDVLEHAAFAAFLVGAGVYFLTYASWGPSHLIGHSLNFRLSVASLLAGIALFPPVTYRLARRPVPLPVIVMQTVLGLGAVFAVVWRGEGDLYLWVHVAQAAMIVTAVIVVRTLIALTRERHPWGRWLLASAAALFPLAAVDTLVDAGVLPRTGVLFGELFTPLALVPFALLFSFALGYAWVERRWGEPTDFQTGLMSRDRFVIRLREELLRARRNGTAATIALLRIEIPERVRQREELRVAAVDTLRRSLRQVDLLARFERETVAVLLADTEERGAIVTLERLRHAVADALHAAGGRPRTTAGVVQYRPGRHSGPEEVVAEAEAALYAALSEGGDCTTTTP
jgi:GGDEF domain-containing protein